ncbi:MAG: hypothetical protein M0T69_02120 [Deltaproteobacteria bacterium]|nr:hypothetical protein [Deltaproteobacteria bacterium]
MTCPTCGKRTYQLILWSLVLFFVSVFYAVKLVSPLLKNSRDENKEFVRRAVPLTDPGQLMKAAHADWDNTDCNLVAERKIRLFMAKPKVLEAWGSPVRVITTHDAAEFKKETWVLSGDRKVTFNLIGAVESFEEPSSALAAK